MTDMAPLVNKTVPFRFRGADLKLDLSHALFSSFDVDAGTRLLLKAVGRDEVLLRARRVLDAGCGVGVIGLSVAAALPGALVEARDRDLLACAFTERNRERNKVPNLGVRPGLLATGAETGPFDYILTNIPAKGGGPVLEKFFMTAPDLLVPGGRLAVVIVKPLAESAKKWLAAAGFCIVAGERGANHLVFVAERGAPEAAPPTAARAVPATPSPMESPRTDFEPLDFSALDLDVYVRRRGRFSLAGLQYETAGIWGLPEFDTVGYGNAAAAELGERVLAGSLVRDMLVVNPGLGHLAIWAARRLAPERLVAASRDYLSLAATAANLAAQPRPRPLCEAMDALRLDELSEASFDCIAWSPDIVPEYDWIAPLWDAAARLLKRGGSLIVGCPPTELARIMKRRPQGFRNLGEKKKKSFAATAWCRE
jgi:16S rRNA G1207 methylase RsmC